MSGRSDELGRHAGRYYGKYRGLVVDDADEKHQGTISVKVPSVFGPTATVRARACMPYGHFFVPPKDTHVWVEFEAGRPDLPLWVGVWHPDGAAPAEAQVSPPNHRVVQTAAGHTIEFVDEQGAERIVIRHSSDAFVSIDSKGNVLVSNPKGSHLHLDAEGEKTTLVEQHGNFLTMGEKGTSIVNPKGTTIDLSGDTLNVSAPKVVVQSQSVALGAGANARTINGTAFKTLWTLLMTHTHPTAALGPPSPPTPPIPPLVDGTHLTSEVLVK
jgi:hypothetical protein